MLLWKSFLRIGARFLVSLAYVHRTAYANRVARITFGSCNKQWMDQPLWEKVLQRNPDLWIWTGDAVYHDSAPNVWEENFEMINLHTITDNVKEIKVPDPLLYSKNYDEQLSNPHYFQIMQTTPIIGIWDDHDYGCNDCNYLHPYKIISKREFLAFIKNSNLNEKYAQCINQWISEIEKHDGMYSLYSFTKDNLLIDIYLLDNRWFLDHKTGTILGDEQWNWLINTIEQRSTIMNPDMTLFVSGLQVLPIYKRDWYDFESWGRYSEKEKIRLRDLILNSLNNNKMSNALILSGDVHFSEIMKYKCSETNNNNDNNHYNLYEFTVSGLTHVFKHTIFLDYFWDYVDAFDTDGATIQLIDEINFGEIEINYNQDEIIDVKLNIHSLNGMPISVDFPVNSNINKVSTQNMVQSIRDNDINWQCQGYKDRTQLMSILFVSIINCILKTRSFVLMLYRN